MDWQVIIPIVLSIAALVYTAVSFRHTANQSCADDATQRATLTANVQYIKDSIDEIRVQYKTISADVTILRDRVTAVEQSAKSAHKRMDDYVKQHGPETGRYSD